MTAHPHPPHEATFNQTRRIVQTALVALLLALVAPGAAFVSASPSPPAFYVESTGHILADPFLTYWVENDGSRSLGLPVSDIVDRNGRAAQYFQYGVLVLENHDAATRLRAGVDLLAQLTGDPVMIAGRRSPSPRTTQALPTSDTVEQSNLEGTHTTPIIDAELLQYWQRWGGSELLGAPISIAYRQGNTRTQWFEFGRIDLDPTGASLAEIGRELAHRSNIPTGPADRGNLPLFDPTRFLSFSGDGIVPNADGPFDPARLEIPSIQIDADIEVTTVQDGVMTNPTDPWNAGWYAAFARPGEWTNTVIAGHRDWWGYGPVVFWNLDLLQSGDKIYLLAADGTGATYIVSSTTLVSRTVDPQTIINDIGYEALTLITCGGSWTGTEYTGRIIVRAYRI